jgi:hypothetical protein
MKHTEKGRSQRLPGKRKSNKPSTKNPSALRQHEVALRKKTKLDNARKRANTASKKEVVITTSTVKPRRGKAVAAKKPVAAKAAKVVKAPKAAKTVKVAKTVKAAKKA